MAGTSSNNSIIRSGSSTSSSPRRNYYDVFVSFRGTDTRLNFTDHLFGALQRKHIFAFRDDTKLNKGESIAPELLQAIEDSRIFIVVFSKNYASSTWCLRELEHILLHCGQPPEKRVLPVFYDVDPSEVRHQKRTYGKALAKHEQKFQQDLEQVVRWRAALAQVADLSGWDVRDKPQYAEIEKIVEGVINISTRGNYFDVFVSFRGEDTRYNFTDHLFAALQRKSISAFRDDTKLNKGESIAPEVLRAIEYSQIFIVVFSKNYATSTWCLRELECILERVQAYGKRVLPVFYDVDLSEVRYQRGTYGEALANHQQDSEMMLRWKTTLREVTNFSGWDVGHKSQYAEIENIVEEVYKYIRLQMHRDLN
ncbi:unnamed protein product [Lathyrus sativus]|nr:unnamed protein product [Lathyrus sativus]